jgi:hypothetical protein
MLTRRRLNDCSPPVLHDERSIMPNPSKPLATIRITGHQRVLTLPRSLWPSPLHIGERVRVESDVGDVWCALEVQLGPDESPIVELPCAASGDARRCYVRLACPVAHDRHEDVRAQGAA